MNTLDLEKYKKAEKMADLTFELLDRCQEKQEKMANNLDLTIAEFKLLRSFKDDQILTVSELSKRIELSSSRLTRIIDGLVKKKFVTRELAQKDRRMMEIKLTPSGKKIQDKINETYIKTHQDILELLPPGADESVLFAIEKLRDAMGKWTS